MYPDQESVAVLSTHKKSLSHPLFLEIGFPDTSLILCTVLSCFHHAVAELKVAKRVYDPQSEILPLLPCTEKSFLTSDLLKKVSCGFLKEARVLRDE